MEKKSSATSKEKILNMWRNDSLIAILSGVAAAVIMFGGTYAIGFVNNYEAKHLLEAIMPTTRFLCSAIMTASATIIALMLTLLGMSFNVDVSLSDDFFNRIRKIAFYDSMLLVFSTGVLILHCFPITESSDVPAWWYLSGYYIILSSSTLLGGGLISLTVLLYLTISKTISTFGVGSEGHFVVEDDSD